MPLYHAKFISLAVPTRRYIEAETPEAALRIAQTKRAAELTFGSLREAVFFAKRCKLFSAYRCFMDAVHFAVEG